MSTTEGMESVNFLLEQIDRKFQFYDENLAIVQQAVALNHAMLMSACIFCDRELEVGFTELTPEARWQHILEDHAAVRPEGSIPLITLPEIIYGVQGLTLSSGKLHLEVDDNLRFLGLDKRDRCQHCMIRFEQISLIAPENVRRNGEFTDTEARRDRIRRHRIECSYIVGGGATTPQVPLYGNIPVGTGGATAPSVEQLFKEFDDHDILHDLAETEENSRTLGALRKARQSFDKWGEKKKEEFSLLSVKEKQDFLKSLKRAHCPKCLERIDFGVEDFQTHNEACDLPVGFTRFITPEVATLFREYRAEQGGNFTAEMINADFMRFDKACLKILRIIGMADNCVDTLSDDEWSDQSGDESLWGNSDDGTDGGTDDGTDDDDCDDGDDGDNGTPPLFSGLEGLRGVRGVGGIGTSGDKGGAKGKPAVQSKEPADKPPVDPESKEKLATQSKKPTEVKTPESKERPATQSKKPTEVKTPESKEKPVTQSKKPTDKLPAEAKIPEPKKTPESKKTPTVQSEKPANKPPVDPKSKEKPATQIKKPTEVKAPESKEKPATQSKKPTEVKAPESKEKPVTQSKKPTEVKAPESKEKPATQSKKPVDKPPAGVEAPKPKKKRAIRVESSLDDVDPVVRFYSGGTDYRGRTLRGMLKIDRGKLDDEHDDFIEVLFPNTGISTANPQAPVITARTIKAFKPIDGGNPLRTNLLAACALMGEYYGFEFNMPTYVVLDEEVRKPGAEKKYKWLNKNDPNHNHIGRIIICLRLLGMAEEAVLFHKAILDCFGNRKGMGYNSSKGLWKASLESSMEGEDMVVRSYFEDPNDNYKTFAKILRDEVHNNIWHFLLPSKAPAAGGDWMDTDVERSITPTKDEVRSFQNSPEVRKKQHTAYLQIINHYGFQIHSNNGEGNKRRVFMLPTLKVSETNFPWVEENEHWELLGHLVRSLRLLGGDYEQDGIVFYNSLIKLIRDLDRLGRVGPSVEALKLLRICGQENPGVVPKRLSSPHPSCASSPSPLNPTPEFEIEEYGEWVEAAEAMALERSLLDIKTPVTKASSGEETSSQRKRVYVSNTSHSAKRQKVSPDAENPEHDFSSLGNPKELPWIKNVLIKGGYDLPVEEEEGEGEEKVPMEIDDEETEAVVDKGDTEDSKDSEDNEDKNSGTEEAEDEGVNDEEEKTEEEKWDEEEGVLMETADEEPEAEGDAGDNLEAEEVVEEREKKEEEEEYEAEEVVDRKEQELIIKTDDEETIGDEDTEDEDTEDEDADDEDADDEETTGDRDTDEREIAGDEDMDDGETIGDEDTEESRSGEDETDDSEEDYGEDEDDGMEEGERDGDIIMGTDDEETKSEEGTERTDNTDTEEEAEKNEARGEEEDDEILIETDEESQAEEPAKETTDDAIAASGGKRTKDTEDTEDTEEESEGEAYVRLEYSPVPMNWSRQEESEDESPKQELDGEMNPESSPFNNLTDYDDETDASIMSPNIKDPQPRLSPLFSVTKPAKEKGKFLNTAKPAFILKQRLKSERPLDLSLVLVPTPTPTPSRYNFRSRTRSVEPSSEHEIADLAQDLVNRKKATPKPKKTTAKPTPRKATRKKATPA